MGISVGRGREAQDHGVEARRAATRLGLRASKRRFHHVSRLFRAEIDGNAPKTGLKLAEKHGRLGASEVGSAG